MLLSNISFDSNVTFCTSHDKPEALTSILKAKACFMPHVCKLGNAVAVLDIFRALRESAAVVI